jgi:DNA-binding PadR family transcriptional regulator
LFHEHPHHHGFGHPFARRHRDLHADEARHRSHGHGMHGRHGRRGLGRFFAHGDLRLVILNLIAQEPRHGYDIIKAIEAAAAGAYSPSPGVIYPTLTLLEDLGYVTVSTEGVKKLHEITPEGRSFLDANRNTLDALLSRMSDGNTAQHRGRAPAIVRAMENLKVALRLRITQGPVTNEQIDAIAALIDAAAAKIEKI